MHDRDRDFGEYVDGRALVMRRTAYLLCGDWHRAEGLVQTALAKIYVAWPRLDRLGSVDAYARKVLVRTAIDDSRLAFRRRETVAGAQCWNGEEPGVQGTRDVAPDARADRHSRGELR